MSKLIQTPILPVVEEANNNRVVGALICLNELDPEVTDIFKIHKSEIDTLKVETDSLRHLFRHLKGLTKDKVEEDLDSMKREVRLVSRQLVEFCDNLQSFVEQEAR